MNPIQKSKKDLYRVVKARRMLMQNRRMQEKKAAAALGSGPRRHEAGQKLAELEREEVELTIILVRELRRIFKKICEMEDSRQRLALILIYLGGMTAKEAAANMNESERTFYRILKNALTQYSTPPGSNKSNERSAVGGEGGLLYTQDKK